MPCVQSRLIKPVCLSNPAAIFTCTFRWSCIMPLQSLALACCTLVPLIWSKMSVVAEQIWPGLAHSCFHFCPFQFCLVWGYETVEVDWSEFVMAAKCVNSCIFISLQGCRCGLFCHLCPSSCFSDTRFGIGLSVLGRCNLAPRNPSVRSP